MNIQLGQLGSSLGLSPGTGQSPLQFATSLLRQFGGNGTFDTAGLANALNTLSQTDADMAGNVGREIDRQLPSVAKGQLARELSALETNAPPEIAMGDGYISVADTRLASINQA